MTMTAEEKDAVQALLNLGKLFICNSRAAMETAAGEVQDLARMKHKFRSRSGAAVASIVTEVKEVGDVTEGIVKIDPEVSNAPYAVYLHEGTGKYGPKGQPYDIFPKNKKMLKFLTSPGTALWRQSPYGRFHEGGFTYAFGVTHPGIKGEPFVENALGEKESRINEIFQSYYDKTIEEAELS